jgi:hypothetical protein
MLKYTEDILSIFTSLILELFQNYLSFFMPKFDEGILHIPSVFLGKVIVRINGKILVCF